MANARILVVDDDHEIARLLRSYLEQDGYEVQTAHEGEEALATLRHMRPDLVLLDVMLPNRDGYEITRVIRGDQALADTPIIMITARIEDTDKVIGLEMGADDYITKPFNPRELQARVKAMLRRQRRASGSTQAAAIQIGQLRMDASRHEVVLADQELDLTRTEFSLLKALMQNPGYVFTRSELIEKALGHGYESIERTLDTHIKNLRRKIGDDPKKPDYILTVYGIGYRMAEQ